jgi:hypothetical protein
MRMIRQEMAELLKKLSLLIRPSLRSTGIFFQKNYFSQNYLKHIRIDSVFKANSKYHISFESNRSFSNQKLPKKRSQIHKNCIPRLMCLDMFQVTGGLEAF